MILGTSPPALAGGEAVTTRKVDLAAVVELGKVEPANGVTAAGQPDEAAFRVFADSGYKVVIDLRTANEDRGLDEPTLVESLGMEYVSLPIGADDITFDKARELDELLDGYEEPVLLHCASSNRIGALLALSSFVETGDAELAIETGRAAGMRSLERTVRELIRAHYTTNALPTRPTGAR